MNNNQEQQQGNTLLTVSFFIFLPNLIISLTANTFIVRDSLQDMDKCTTCQLINVHVHVHVRRIPASYIQAVCQPSCHGNTHPTKHTTLHAMNT